MKVAVFVLALAALPAWSQGLRLDRMERCQETVAASAEAIDLPGGANGRAASFDWLGCARGTVLYSAGASRYSLGGVAWNAVRVGVAARFEDVFWPALDVTAGKVPSSGGDIAYVRTRAALTWRIAAPFLARLDHQYVNAAPERGHLVTAAVIAQPITALLAELSHTRSTGGNLGASGWGARVDWVQAPGRVFAGYGRGRDAPRAVDVVAGSLADRHTRSRYAAAFATVGAAEAGITWDEIRREAVARRTWAVVAKWPLP